MKNKFLARRRMSRLGTLAMLAACAAASLSGCDSKQILTVSDPDVARPASLDDPSALPALRAGAIGAFGAAYDGSSSDEQQVTLSASLGDEFINTRRFRPESSSISGRRPSET